MNLILQILSKRKVLKEVIHITGKLLGFLNYTLPHATATGPEIVKGLNYASGGAGILKRTGRNLVN